MSETNEQKIAFAELSAAVETLVLAANRYKCATVGFVFGADPVLMIRFGNVKETGPALAELYLNLSDLAEEKEMNGEVMHHTIRPEGSAN